jgi:cell division protein FtsQ
MADGGRVEGGSRRRARAASVVVPFPLREHGDRLDLARLVPSGRSLLVALGVVIGVLAAYWGARVSPAFDVQRVDVQGAPPGVADEVRAATRRTVGTSLLALDTQRVEDQVRALPSIAGVSVDRAFPHTLVVKVAVERTVAVARRGNVSWLVTASGKVVREIPTGSARTLPRIWLTKDVTVRLGDALAPTYATEARVLAAVRAAHLRRQAGGITATDNELTVLLRDGPEIRLGEPTDVALKLAVAAQIFRLRPAGTRYIDVSVPERSVTGTTLNP